MKYDCALIQDILPLYIDDALSTKSKDIIDEHLSECSDCKRIYENRSSAKQDLFDNKNLKNNTMVKKYSKKIKKVHIAIISVVLIVILTLTASLVSMVKFKTPNFVASGLGVIRVMASDTKYVQIQSNPRIIIAKPDNAMKLFLETIESEGYTLLEDEQMGAMHIIEKDGQKESVFFSMNRYFSKWIWE
ncbi:MAG: zf-HC2 domain-containing protein [Oscillospiraceae bacterium]